MRIGLSLECFALVVAMGGSGSEAAAQAPPLEPATVRDASAAAPRGAGWTLKLAPGWKLSPFDQGGWTVARK